MIKKIFLAFCWVTAIFLLLGACQPAPMQTETAIEAAITDTGIQPAKWWVPAGESITLSLSNQGDAIHDWTLLARPLDGSFDEKDRKNILFQITLQPGEFTTITFHSPDMPGEYDVISAQPGNVDAGLVARLIAVQP